MTSGGRPTFINHTQELSNIIEKESKDEKIEKSSIKSNSVNKRAIALSAGILIFTTSYIPSNQDTFTNIANSSDAVKINYNPDILDKTYDVFTENKEGGISFMSVNISKSTFDQFEKRMKENHEEINYKLKDISTELSSKITQQDMKQFFAENKVKSYQSLNQNLVNLLFMIVGGGAVALLTKIIG